MGGGGGKGKVKDNSAELYRQQQADLAAQRQSLEDEEAARKADEQARRDSLREAMLAGRDVLSADDGEGTLLKSTLG